MQNFVSFETAKRLKQAGFPQPEYETGQFWYGDTGKLCVITHAGEYLTGFTVLNGLREIWDLEGKDSDAVFAPTATDILREIGKPDLLKIAGQNIDDLVNIMLDQEIAAAAWLQDAR